MAGASAADMRGLFHISDPSTPTPAQQVRSAAPSTVAGAGASKRASGKPEGISRELYALIGPSAPALAAQLAKPRFKQKPALSGGARATKWESRTFKNPARRDNLELNHWTRASSDPTSEYPFAKYNVQPQVYTYSQDEYNRLLIDEDWTKEETDYLFDLIREYDVRFYVVADRYDYPGGKPRSIDDIKDRYCSVCRRLIRNRPWAGDENSKTQLLSSYTFDKEREITRKKYIASLESRTPEQIAEEEALYVEIKRLEQIERKFAREREELLRTIAGIESGLPSIAIASHADEEAYTSIFNDGKGTKKRKGGNFDIDSPISAGPSVISLGPPLPPPKRVQSAKMTQQDIINCIHRTDTDKILATKAAHQPVTLRSYKTPVVKHSLDQKIEQALAELGIQHRRLVMPTRENIMQLDGLIEAATSLVETKRVVDRVEQDIRIAHARLAEREKGEGQGGDDIGVEDADMEEGEEKEDADGDYDGDEGDADAEADADGEADEGDREGRAASASASVNSIGRKKVKRSMSISSADTSATTATRASRKKQKS